jgi:hypothetical protein
MRSPRFWAGVRVPAPAASAPRASARRASGVRGSASAVRGSGDGHHVALQVLQRELVQTLSVGVGPVQVVDLRFESITGTAANLVGLHATDPATVPVAVGTVPVVTVADLGAELYQRRTLVKHLAMRRTLWMVRTEDLPLIHEMTRNMLADTMIGPLEP